MMTSPDKYSDLRPTFGPAAYLKSLWQTVFLRNILMACLAVSLLLPAYNGIYVNPSYRDMLSTLKENHAKQAATHLTRMLGVAGGSFSRKALEPAFTPQLATFQRDFGLEKIKVFDPLGSVVFSTDAQDIGQRNRRPYFTEKVAKGKIYSHVTPKGGATLENRIVERDVVEVYIPVMAGDDFLGAFEIYYDITEPSRNLNRLLMRSNLIMLLIAFIMMAFVIITLLKAGGAVLVHKHMDEALHQAHEDLEKRVQARTLDLINANKELQLEIIERRQVAEALQKSEDRFRTLVETIPHGIVEIDTRGVITFANPALFKMYGYEQSELIGRSLFDLAVGDKVRQQHRENLAYLLRQQPYPTPWFSRDYTKDGRAIETQVDWQYRFDHGKQIAGLIAVISEITHRKQAEKALLDNLTFLGTLIDTIPNPVFFKEAQGYFLGCNLAYAHSIGLEKEQITGRRLIDLPDIAFKDMAEHFHRQDLWLIEHPGIRTHEEQILCADGVLRDYMLFKATFQDAEGEVAGLVGIMMDITERKQAEKQLKETKALFDAFMRHMPGLAYMKDPKGRYLFVNEGFVKFTETAADKMIGLCDDQVWEAHTARLLQANDAKVFKSQGAANTLETVTLCCGQQRHLLTTRFPILQDESIYALGGVSIDVTERTQAEQQRRQLEIQLQQTHKMEALGTLAGGIAHDFNNILAAIIGYAEIVLAETAKDHPNHRYLARVLEAGERARSLVKQILVFSRQGEIDLKPVQVRLIVKEVLKLLRASLPVTIDIVQEIKSDAAVMADPVQIHQVMMNLCTNAGYAMRRNGGVLTVRLEQVALDPDLRRRNPGLAPGSYLRLTVSDTGEGMPPDILNRIFDPFFTTKPKGEGTGMGLSVVHGIVTGLGGVVTVESKPDQGSRFDIYLPVIEDQAQNNADRTQALPVGSERILFVDDEVFQTDMLKHLLGLLGYTVETRNTGRDALLLFERDPLAFDLVLTDMIMPDMTGDALAKRMLELRPDLPIILCTGYSQHINEAKAKEMGLKAYALKPLVMEELARLIRRVLDSSDNS